MLYVPLPSIDDVLEILDVGNVDAVAVGRRGRRRERDAGHEERIIAALDEPASQNAVGDLGFRGGERVLADLRHVGARC